MTSGGWLVLAGALLELPPLAAGLLEPPLAEVFELLDEQAARPAARSVTAPAVSTLLPGILLIVNSDLSSRILRFREGALVSWLDGAARDLRGGYVQSPARRRPVGRQQLEGGVVPLAPIHSKRAPVAERASGGGWAASA